MYLPKGISSLNFFLSFSLTVFRSPKILCLVRAKC
jgi:hypothetical protein